MGTTTTERGATRRVNSRKLEIFLYVRKEVMENVGRNEHVTN